MYVRRLSLTDYRNYARAELELTPGTTVFAGRNGQGKTNLIESICYLATLGSHRVSNDHALVRSGAESAVIRALVGNGDRELLIELQINKKGANRAQLNRSPLKTRELPHYAHTVLFAPEDLAIVRGEPAIRRRMLDELLFQRSPRMAGVITDYERVLKQRNSLLKSARARGLAGTNLSTLDIWDERLVNFGTEIIEQRLKLIADLAKPLANAYRSIVAADHNPKLRPILSIDSDSDEDNDELVPKISNLDGTLETEYQKKSYAATAERFMTALQRSRQRELERGISLIGPHRDDVLLLLNGMPAKGYASHGESWSFVLSLRLAAAALLREDSMTGDPVLVLDDVFAELDKARRNQLASAIVDFEQVLITAAVIEDVPTDLISNVVHIASGQLLDEPVTLRTESPKGAE